MIPTLNTGYWWLDAYLYFCLSMFALMVYRRWLQKKLSYWMMGFLSPLLIVFALVDALCNFTICRFMGPTPYKTWSMSERFADYRDVAYPKGFNKTVANVLCGIINQFDDLHC